MLNGIDVAETHSSRNALTDVRSWLWAAGVGLGYWLLGEPCQRTAAFSLAAPLVWLSPGFLFAALALGERGNRILMGLFALAASFLVEFRTTSPGGGSVFFAIGAPAAAFAPLALRIGSAVPGPWAFLGIASLLAGITALAKLAVSQVVGTPAPWAVATGWFGATLIGVLLVAPLTMAIAEAIRRRAFVRTVFWLEWLALIAVTAALAIILFFRESNASGLWWPGPYLIFPVFIWAALRLGMLGAATSLFLVGVLAAAATPANLGPIAKLAETDEMRLLLFQSFLLVAGMSAYLLAGATQDTSRALQEVALAEERYRSIYEGASDAIFLAGRDGVCIAANQAASELTGFSREELVGKRAEDLIDAADLARRPSQVELALRGIGFIHERLLRRKDGSPVSVEFSIKPLPDGRIIAICRDLSERKRQETAIRAIVSGTAVHIGEEFFQQLVRTLAEALGVKHAHVGELLETQPPTVRMLAVWSDGEARAPFTYTLRGTPCEKSIAESICHCPEGVQQAFPEDTMLGKMGAVSYLGLVIRNRLEAPMGLLAVMDDKRLEATESVESMLRIFAARAGAELERLRSEAALRESEMRQRALLEAFPDALFVMTLDGVYLDYHTQEPEGLRLPPHEFIGKSYRDVMPAELHRDFDQAFEDLRQGRRARVFEYESDVRGSPRYFEVRHSHAGEGLVLAILRDVTLRKEYDEEIQKLNENLERLVEQRTEQLAAANRELESFAYSVSHDLRAPLRGIHANASILREDLGPKLEAEDAEALDRIVARATEMSNLIDGLLKISRIMRAELQREPVDLSAMAQEAYESVVRWHPGRTFEVEIRPGMHVRGDRVLLSAALTNLFDNAAKFTVGRDPAKIRFGSTVEDFETVYFVSDNGVGFNMEHAGKLFRPFERLHTVEEFAGTGIGLATVHRVVQRHGGRIWAEGKVGEGATFYFTLGPSSSAA